MSQKYTAIVSAFIRPFSPGLSGGEIRDFHIFRHLASLASLRLIAMSDSNLTGRGASSTLDVEEAYSPALLTAHFPQFVDRRALRRSLLSRFIGLLRLLNLPVWGVNYHRDIALVEWQVQAYVLPILRHLLLQTPPDFLFVTPQLNPTLLHLKTALPKNVRTILLTYDVEAVRLSRLAEAQVGLARYAGRLEAQRAETFERENLRLFDGVVVVSDLDRSAFIEKYGMDPERVLTIENSVDVDYFAFEDAASEPNDPNIVFVGNLAYWPNHDAAIRLMTAILPRVRESQPRAKLWVVGDRPSRELEAVAPPESSTITGRVDDVRPYLRQASVVCIPLRAGSGTKYKVLEALSAGRPVVCTSLAAEGLGLEPGVHYLLAETDDEIASACLQVLREPSRFRDMTRRARQFVEQNYSWEHNLQKLDGWLAKIKDMPCRSWNAVA